MPINSFANKILSIPHLEVFLKGLNCSSGLHNSNKSNAMVAILKFKLLWKLTTFLHKNCCTPVLGLYIHTPCFQKQKYILITQQMPENCLFIFQLTNLMLIFFYYCQLLLLQWRTVADSHFKGIIWLIVSPCMQFHWSTEKMHKYYAYIYINEDWQTAFKQRFGGVCTPKIVVMQQCRNPRGTFVWSTVTRDAAILEEKVNFVSANQYQCHIKIWITP